MLPTSISTRVIAAFGTVVAVVLLLLAAGWMVAGDVRHGSVKRVASSVGEGSIAVSFVHQHLANVR